MSVLGQIEKLKKDKQAEKQKHQDAVNSYFGKNMKQLLNLADRLMTDLPPEVSISVCADDHFNIYRKDENKINNNLRIKIRLSLTRQDLLEARDVSRVSRTTSFIGILVSKQGSDKSPRYEELLNSAKDVENFIAKYLVSTENLIHMPN